MVRIDDKEFAEVSGSAVHRTAIFTGRDSDFIEGKILEITNEELQLVDSYEPTGYSRKQVDLNSGKTAWFYSADTD